MKIIFPFFTRLCANKRIPVDSVTCQGHIRSQIRSIQLCIDYYIIVKKAQGDPRFLYYMIAHKYRIRIQVSAMRSDNYELLRMINTAVPFQASELL